MLDVSDAEIRLSAFAVAGTVNVATKPPDELDVTAAGVVVSAVSFNLNVILFPAIKWLPDTVTV